jgi:Tol biopolymer transport system component
MLRRALLVVPGIGLLAVLLLAAGASPGSAAFPGGNGRIAYSCYPGSQELCVINADGSGLGYLTQDDRGGATFDERYPAWSVDGRRIAFVVVGYCLNAIYVMNADRTSLRRVLLERGERSGMWTIQELSWSPDGNRLVYTKSFNQGQCPMEYSAGITQLFTISVSGSDERRITNGGPGDLDLQPAWSPDGRSIAFQHERYGFDDWGLYVMNPDGSSRRRLDLRGAGSPDWSPDGTRIAYECTTTFREICVYSEGSGVTRLGVGSTPAWSPDGTRIVFALQPGQSQADPGGGIYVMAADGTQRREIDPTTGYANEGMGHPHWQPCRGVCPPAPGLPSSVKRAQAPQPLFAKVGPGFTIAIRNKARRRVKKLVEGTYSARINDSSRRHSLHVSGLRGKFDSRTTVSAVVHTRQTWQLAAGSYRYFCDAHKARMRGRFSVIADPRGPYRP